MHGKNPNVFGGTLDEEAQQYPFRPCDVDRRLRWYASKYSSGAEAGRIVAKLTVYWEDAVRLVDRTIQVMQKYLAQKEKGVRNVESIESDDKKAMKRYAARYFGISGSWRDPEKLTKLREILGKLGETKAFLMTGAEDHEASGIVLGGEQTEIKIVDTLVGHKKGAAVIGGVVSRPAKTIVDAAGKPTHERTNQWVAKPGKTWEKEAPPARVVLDYNLAIETLVQGTRKAVLNIIHEASHAGAATFDYVYFDVDGKSKNGTCRDEDLMDNADSYGWFCIKVGRQITDIAKYQLRGDVQLLSSEKSLYTKGAKTEAKLNAPA